MKKRTIAMAVAGTMFAAGSAFAAEITVDGFAEVQWNLTNEAAEEEEGQFAVTEAEVNFDSEHLFVAATASDQDDFSIGQAFAKYAINDAWRLKAGKFDSNFTADYGSAPDREFVQHSLLFDLLSAVGGESLTGAAVTGDIGPATVTLAYANDTSVTPLPFVLDTDPGTPGNQTQNQVDGENSIMLLVNASPLEGLDLELGLLTQDKDGGGAGNLININGTYAINAFTVGLDYLQGSDNETVFDNGYSVWAGYDFGNGFDVKARFENASADGADDVETTELQASYALNDNLAVAVSLHNLDNGTTDFDTNVIQLIGTF